MNTIFLELLYSLEHQCILKEIQANYLLDNDEDAKYSNEEHEKINSNLLIVSENNLAFTIHRKLINSLITIYIGSQFPKLISKLSILFEFEPNLIIDHLTHDQIVAIPEVLEELHVTFLNSEYSFKHNKLIKKKSKHHLRETGAVYTLKKITREMVDNTIARALENGISAENLKCLDFACGTGRFYFEAIDILRKKYGLSLHHIVSKTLFAVDIDKNALSVLRLRILSLFSSISSDLIDALSLNIIQRNALIPKTTLLEDCENSIDLTFDFVTVFAQGGFDVVFSNPPYYLLKVNKKDENVLLSDYYALLQRKIQNEINFFRTSGFYHYSIEGMLNYYQISIEMILRLTKDKGQIGIICPSSLFADLTSAKLRKHLLNYHKLHFIRYYPESARLFENVAQSTVIFYLQKGLATTNIFIEILDNFFEIDLETIKMVFPTNHEIPLIEKIGWSILTKISSQKKIKQIPYIRNRRGELDLTLFKQLISKTDSGWRLIRGNMISNDGIINKNGEYVDIEAFLDKKSEDYKVNDFNQVRLICQQISNIDMDKRLRFVFCEQNDILGNSCNYIVSKRGKEDLNKLYYLLNSKLLNWRFKISSSNNHINNYELDELPIIDLDFIDLNIFSENETENDIEICKLYRLTPNEIEYILKDTVTEKSVLKDEIV